MLVPLKTILFATTFSTCAWAYPAVNDGAPIQSQTKGKTLEELASLIKPATVTDAEPELRPDAKRRIVRYGPFDVPGFKEMNISAAGGHAPHAAPAQGGLMSGGSGMGSLDVWDLLRGDVALAIGKFLASTMDPEGFNFIHQAKEGICKDCSVLASKIDVVFENGSRASISTGVYLHHIVTLNMANRTTKSNLLDVPFGFCAGNDMVMSLASNFQKFTGLFKKNVEAGVFGFAAVDEFKQLFTTADGKFDSGYYLGKEDQLLLQGEIVNYRKEPQKLYLQMDIEYMPGRVGKEAATTISNVQGCSDPLAFLGQKGPGARFGAPVTVKKAGTIVAARGHMHDGGESMSFAVNGDRRCVSRATYGTSYNGKDAVTGKTWTTISKMSGCGEAIHVKAGDTISLVADYDTIAHPLRESSGEAQAQMGLVAFTFVPDA